MIVLSVEEEVGQHRFDPEELAVRGNLPAERNKEMSTVQVRYWLSFKIKLFSNIKFSCRCCVRLRKL